MKSLLLILAGIAFSAAVFFGSSLINPTGSAQKIARVQFEYCAINASYISYQSENQPTLTGVANVCYFQAEGCRNEEIKTEFAVSRFLQDFRLENTAYSKKLAINKARENAIIKAAAKLGAEGWELSGQPALVLDNYVPNSQNSFTIYDMNKDLQPNIVFKRVRQ